MVRLVPDAGPWPEGQLFVVELRVAPLSSPFETESVVGVFLTSASSPLTATASFVDTDDDGHLGAGEVLVIEFSQFVYSIFSDEPETLVYEFDFDLDGSGLVGDAEGEYGAFDEFRDARRFRSGGRFASWVRGIGGGGRRVRRRSRWT